MKDNESAVSYYKDALSMFSNDLAILSNLAKLYMMVMYMKYYDRGSNVFLLPFR